MTVGSVGDLGSAPAMAVFGFASRISLRACRRSCLSCRPPLVSAELASGWPGGVYNWVSEGISAPMGLLAIWCQFAQTVFYYPALLAYVGEHPGVRHRPRLAGNGVYTAAVIIVLFWGGVLPSSRGLHLIAKLASSGIVLGTLVPGAILVVMGLVYLIPGLPPRSTDGRPPHLLPAWSGLASIVLIVSSFFTYAGIEMNAVHVDELLQSGARVSEGDLRSDGDWCWRCSSSRRSPSRGRYPFRSRSASPPGVMQALTAFLAHFGLIFAVPLIRPSRWSWRSLSGMMAWLAGPSKGLLNIGPRAGLPAPLLSAGQRGGVFRCIFSSRKAW